MNKRLIIAVSLLTLVIYISSCYRNKEDILSLPKVSFRNEIVPIATSGGCGCHNNGIASRAVQFSHGDTVFYDAILSRVSLLDAWVKGGTHPGGGLIDFSVNEKSLIQRWIAEGAKDDGGGCTVTGTITYTANIQPIYTTTCKGSTCHGGIAIALDYNVLVGKKSNLEQMVSSGGSKGHPGGTLSLGACTLNTLNEWLKQGQPK